MYCLKRSLIKKWLFPLIIIPWFLAALILMRFEVRSFHLDETWDLSRDERRNYFVKREFNAMGDEFDDDYFELLRKAQPIISQNSKLEWYSGKSISKLQHFHALIYAHFWLVPASPLNIRVDRSWTNYWEPNTEEVMYKIYYQKEPHTQDEMIIHKIHVKKPSYITKVIK